MGLGFIMALSALLFGACAAVVMSRIVSGRERGWWAIGFVLPVVLGLAYLTTLLAWRLLTGQERRGGGLFPPWVLYVTGAMTTWSARGPGWTSGFRSASEENVPFLSGTHIHQLIVTSALV